MPGYEWFMRRQDCLVIEIACLHNHIEENAQELQSIFTHGANDRVRIIALSHCSAVTVPPSIRGFSYLHTIQVDSSTLVEWSASASLTKEYHSSLTIMRFFNTNFTDGVLPVGIRSPEMSSTLFAVLLINTNLRELPTDLHKSWRNLLQLVVAQSFLGEFPSTVIRMTTLIDLELDGNGIKEIPKGALDNQKLHILSLTANPIASLPRDLPVSVLAGTYKLFLQNTLVSSVPEWLRAFLTENQNAVLAKAISVYGSLFCSNRATRSLLHDNAGLDSINFLLVVSVISKQMCSGWTAR